MKRVLLIAIIALAGCKPSADKAVELAKKRSQPIQGILIAPSLDM
jgi:hypothetical protein